ncbi:hypothetical protein G7Z17_g1324 [Cylindrodendrum hubeiense]|uniref:F-box domain-containing protein n=1 Tax=Cylindrodendrum hubeiense TaxID=595255 RepID=A0A9P5HJN0_9HYPO|nr:hypothetical protein G7Z17_g1324 [Cylindrodendrum hubeiense]
MASLSELPPLLLGEILVQITTFEALHSAISASPALYRVFRDQGPTVINAVATNALEPELHNVVNAISRIRNQTVPQSINTLDLFRETYAANLSSPERHSPLSVYTTPQVCFGLVVTIVNIRRLAIAVLDELLKRTSRLSPQHSVKRTIDFASGTYSRTPGSDPWPAAQAVRISPSATERAPSWVEYYRVQRALWLIQLALEVRRHAPWLAWGTGQERTSQTREWGVGKLVSWLPLATETSLVSKALEDGVAARVMPGWDGVSSLKSPLITLTRMPRVVSSNLGQEPSEGPRDDAIGTGWSQDRDAVNRRSDGRRIFTQLLGNRHVSPTASMILNFMYPGLMIWDRERLCDLGLIDEPGQDLGKEKWWEGEDRRLQMTEDEIWFAWYSIGSDVQGHLEDGRKV